MPGTELHQCEECSFTTIRLSHLRRHELLHKKSLVRCDYCDYVTDSRQQLQKHAKMKHPNGNASSPSQQHQVVSITQRKYSSMLSTLFNNFGDE